MIEWLRFPRLFHYEKGTKRTTLIGWNNRNYEAENSYGAPVQPRPPLQDGLPLSWLQVFFYHGPDPTLRHVEYDVWDRIQRALRDAIETKTKGKSFKIELLPVTSQLAGDAPFPLGERFGIEGEFRKKNQEGAVFIWFVGTERVTPAADAFVQHMRKREKGIAKELLGLLKKWLGSDEGGKYLYNYTSPLPAIKPLMQIGASLSLTGAASVAISGSVNRRPVMACLPMLPQSGAYPRVESIGGLEVMYLPIKEAKRPLKLRLARAEASLRDKGMKFIERDSPNQKGDPLQEWANQNVDWFIDRIKNPLPKARKKRIRN